MSTAAMPSVNRIPTPTWKQNCLYAPATGVSQTLVPIHNAHCKTQSCAPHFIVTLGRSMLRSMLPQYQSLLYMYVDMSHNLILCIMQCTYIVQSRQEIMQPLYCTLIEQFACTWVPVSLTPATSAAGVCAGNAPTSIWCIWL